MDGRLASLLQITVLITKPGTARINAAWQRYKSRWFSFPTSSVNWSVATNTEIWNWFEICLVSLEVKVIHFEILYTVINKRPFSSLAFRNSLAWHTRLFFCTLNLQTHREQILLNNLRQTESLQREVRDDYIPMDLLLPSHIDSQEWGCISRCKSGSVTILWQLKLVGSVTSFYR